MVIQVLIECEGLPDVEDQTWEPVEMVREYLLGLLEY